MWVINQSLPKETFGEPTKGGLRGSVMSVLRTRKRDFSAGEFTIYQVFD